MTEKAGNDRHLNWYAAREPLILVVLSAIAIAFFFAVLALARSFDRQQSARADVWFTRGLTDLRAGRPAQAVNEFHAVLAYSRDNYATQLSLAQALLALNRTDEAFQYLANLWQRQPENGMVNLELARIYAGKGDVTQALRYYHNAIYAIWNQDQDSYRRSARLELIGFLLARQSHAQAESELIALSGNLPDDPALMARVGGFFMQVPDYERALAQFRQSLKLDHQNADALKGAGRAAFELARYDDAERYLKLAVNADSDDTAITGLLQTTRFVIQMNPYRKRISRSQRTAAVKEAFETATARLQACLEKVPNTPAASRLQLLNSQVLQMRPIVRRRIIDADTADSAMNLVFNIEQQTNSNCGPAIGRDQALLLIARQNEGE